MNRFLLACTLGACAFPLLSPSAARAAGISISIGDARLVEPPGGQKSMIFPVTLSGRFSEDVRVSYATSVGPNTATTNSITLAQPGLDFSSRQGQITIPALSNRGQIEIPILSDKEVEVDETFQVTLKDVQGNDNNGNSVVLNRSVARGTIVEPIKGVALGGRVITYNVSPFREYDSTTGAFVDNFDAPAKAVGRGNVLVTISGKNTSRALVTDALGNYSALVLPGTYSVEMNSFSLQQSSGDFQNYSLPALNVSLTRDSRSNNFLFFGVAGTVGVPSLFTDSTLISGAYVQVEARAVGASPSSQPLSTATATYTDSRTGKPSRGYRFFLPGLPKGRYTLTFKGVDGDNYYTTNFTFPTPTASLPATSSVNRPVAHLEILGTPKSTSGSNSTRKSSSASGS